MSSTAAHLTAPARTIQSFRRLSLCRSFAQKNAQRKDAIWFRGSLRKSTACRGLPALPWRVCLPWPVGRVTPCAPPRQLHMLILYDRRSCAKVNHHVALIFPRDGIATRRSAERIEVRVRAYLCSEPLDYRLLIQQFYRIAFVHHAFHHDRTV